jgi:hypothetical protein
MKDVAMVQLSRFNLKLSGAGKTLTYYLDPVEPESKGNNRVASVKFDKHLKAIQEFYAGSPYVRVQAVGNTEKHNFSCLMVDFHASKIDQAFRYAICLNYDIMMQTICHTKGFEKKFKHKGLQQHRSEACRRLLAQKYGVDFDTVTRYINAFSLSKDRPKDPLSYLLNSEMRGLATGQRTWYLSICEMFLALKVRTCRYISNSLFFS